MILKGISSQLSSARDRVNAGLPTAMAASSSMIAIGTSHGFILVFDGLQKLKYSLGIPVIGNGLKDGSKSAVNSEKGAVSSLAFNQTNPSDGELLLPSRLLVGFAKGMFVNYIDTCLLRRNCLTWCSNALSVVIFILLHNIISIFLTHNFLYLGHVVEYDMTSGKILRTLDDAHPLGSAVTHVRFTDDHRYSKRIQYELIN